MVAIVKPRPTTQRPNAVVALTDVGFAGAVANLLESTGWDVHMAESASAARKLSAKHAVDVVVLTAERPDESGYLTCAKLGKMKNPPRVLLVTDAISDGRVAFAAYSGASDCLAMSVGPRAVASRVDMLSPGNR